MPSAANVKIDKPAPLPSAENADVSGPAGALKQAIIVIEHKIRNLEKRKSKLESYRNLQNSGKELNSDQKTALAKIDEVLSTLDFAKDLHKQFVGIVVSTEKDAKKQAKREAALKNQAELARLREILLVQDALNQMGGDNVRNDFLNGTNGAAQLSENELKLLDDLYPAVTPKHESGNPTTFTNEVQAAAEHLLAVVDGKSKEAFGGTYSQIKEVLGKIHESGYFDQAEAVEVPVEEEAPVEAVVPEESSEPVPDAYEPSNQEPVPPIESITIEASQHPALHGGVPQQVTSPLVDPAVLAAQVGSQTITSVAAQVPLSVSQDLSFYQQSVQQPPQVVPPPVAQTTPVAPMRPITELVGTGSFFFLQDSEIDPPDQSLPSQIPSQTFTNQTFVGQPPPPIPMPPNFHPSQQQQVPPVAVQPPQANMPPSGPVINHQVTKQPLDDPTLHKTLPMDDLHQKRVPSHHQHQPQRGHSNHHNQNHNSQQAQQQPFYNNGYNGRPNHQRAPPQQSRNNDPNEVSTDNQLPADILKLLGSTPVDNSNVFELNANLLEIWSNIINKGIPTEVKEDLINRYPPLSNMAIMIAPEVNPEIVAAAPEATIIRDKKIQNLQKQLSAALSALGRALSDLIKEEKEGGNFSSRIKIIHTISDACRLILDIHNQQSLLRKNILATCLDQDLKKAITESSTDTLLFGKDLGEKIKEARMLKKAAEDIKLKKPSIKQSSSNFRGLLKQRPVGRPTVSGPKFTRRPPQTRHKIPMRSERRQEQKKFHSTRR